VFDVGGPLALYYLLTGVGVSSVPALVLSGVPPAIGIAIGVREQRHLDVIGMIVLFGIAVGAVAGLTSHSARLVLVDGTVPTAVIGLVCLGSLWTTRPMMFRLALESMGPDTERGREFAARWQYAEFRRAFIVITVVWALVFLAETAVQVEVIETASISTAKTTSNLLPVAIAAIVVLWTFWYGKRQQQKGERIAPATATAAAGVADRGAPAE
jgi:hypothetical protein